MRELQLDEDDFLLCLPLNHLVWPPPTPDLCMLLLVWPPAHGLVWPLLLMLADFLLVAAVPEGD